MTSPLWHEVRFRAQGFPGRSLQMREHRAVVPSTEVRRTSGTAFAYALCGGKPVQQTRRHPKVRQGRIRSADERALFCLGSKIEHVIVDRAVDSCRWQSVRHRRSWAASEAPPDQRKRAGVLPADGRVQLSCDPRGAGQAHASRLLTAHPKALPQTLPHQNHECSDPPVAPRPDPDRPATDRKRDPAGRCAVFLFRTSADSLGSQSFRDPH
jgi:hypothetical protein